MATMYPGTAVVKIFGESEIEESTDRRLIGVVVKMYNAFCDIMNADNGIIDILNKIWEYKHPDEMPNASNESLFEYDILAASMSDDVYQMLSWTRGVDLKDGFRYRLLRTPYLDESADDDIWVFHVDRIPL